MTYPNFSFEKKLWRRGFKFVAGVDEVGRGCFAGPVVAAAVAFAPNSNFQFPISNEDGKKIIIDDSKKLTPRQRERVERWIKKNALSWGVGEVSAATINRLGLAKATKMAFRAAVIDANKILKERIEYLLIDAFYIPYIRGYPIGRKGNVKSGVLKNTRPRTALTSSRGLQPRIGGASIRGKQLAIVNGDEKSLSIAAGSIIAKTFRDKMMQMIGKRTRYKKYDWANNKGYASPKHREAIIKHGITGYHRKQFVETFLRNREIKKI